MKNTCRNTYKNVKCETQMCRVERSSGFFSVTLWPHIFLYIGWWLARHRNYDQACDQPLRSPRVTCRKYIKDFETLEKYKICKIICKKILSSVPAIVTGKASENLLRVLLDQLWTSSVRLRFFSTKPPKGVIFIHKLWFTTIERIKMYQWTFSSKVSYFSVWIYKSKKCRLI